VAYLRIAAYRYYAFAPLLLLVALVSLKALLILALASASFGVVHFFMPMAVIAVARRLRPLANIGIPQVCTFLLTCKHCETKFTASTTIILPQRGTYEIKLS
jgi:hypothetical protein